MVDKIDELVATLISEMANVVKEIEAKPVTTRDHYGDYLSLLTKIRDNTDDTKMQLCALALMRSGANKDGVATALILILRGTA